MADVIADDKEEQRLILGPGCLGLARLEAAKVDFEYRLEKSHVGALVETHLMLPRG